MMRWTSVGRLAARRRIQINAGRSLHSSSSALAKAKMKKVEEDDLFSDEMAADDLFSDTDSAALAASTPSQPLKASTATTPSDPNRVMRRLSSGFLVQSLKPAARQTRFNERLEWAKNHLGRNRKEKDTQVRKSIWNELIQHSTCKGDLQRVANLMPEWKNMQRTFDESVTAMFINRCIEHQCTPFALDIIANRSKYFLELRNLSNARLLLRALYWREPLQLSLTLAATCGAYNIPPLHSDLLSLSMLTAAHLRPPSHALTSNPVSDQTDASPPKEAYPFSLDKETFWGPRHAMTNPHWKVKRPSILARKHAEEHEAALFLAKSTLLPDLKTILDRLRYLPPIKPPVDALKAKAGDKTGSTLKHGGVANMTERERVWLAWALARVEQGLQQEHVGYEHGWAWLRRWRERNGHVKLTGLGVGSGPGSTPAPSPEETTASVSQSLAS